MELFVETHVQSEDHQKGCNSSSTTALSTSWYVHSTILFHMLLFSWIEYDDFFLIFRRHIIISWGRDTRTILRPTRISIWICGWRQDHLVDPIKIGCTDSLTLQTITCGQLIVSQPLGAPNQYWAPSMRRLWPWNNTRLISPSNISNSRRIMNNSTRLLWT
jgi:hypothetical protein